jgi:thiol-disulfide isomerase/thioredoxin
VRPPVDDIPAPPFPIGVPWVNVAPLRMDKQRGRPVLVEFWDFCRPSSLRTLPYLKHWHERYAADGLRVVSVHSPGFPPGEDDDAVSAAVDRLGIEHPVCIDAAFQLWRAYDNEGWPARYLWDQQGRLAEFHFGEGGYGETERAVQELLGVEREPLAPLHPEDDPSASIVVPTPDQPGAYSGPYGAGGVWAVLGGEGELTVDGEAVDVRWPGARLLREHAHHVEGVVDLRVGAGLECYATCFTPGLVPPGD